ncbi:hypothetical protein Igag_0806 [Ignisphaera aggregans DSM 17230]|uniref:Uncharacterized protein n=1 Tax=Ignisphaera aggregans (strain DSM 17230 / JCM 13409 / AQ1.S1) TaxID=583356 RepID=E0STL4_IGNAA|nr:hypothetical protein Igag_0806 [Ignisphaera aggregans DSM 17230]
MAKVELRPGLEGLRMQQISESPRSSSKRVEHGNKNLKIENIEIVLGLGVSMSMYTNSYKALLSVVVLLLTAVSILNTHFIPSASAENIIYDDFSGWMPYRITKGNVEIKNGRAVFNYTLDYTGELIYMFSDGHIDIPASGNATRVLSFSILDGGGDITIMFIEVDAYGNIVQYASLPTFGSEIGVVIEVWVTHTYDATSMRHFYYFEVWRQFGQERWVKAWYRYSIARDFMPNMVKIIVRGGWYSFLAIDDVFIMNVVGEGITPANVITVTSVATVTTTLIQRITHTIMRTTTIPITSTVISTSLLPVTETETVTSTISVPTTVFLWNTVTVERARTETVRETETVTETVTRAVTERETVTYPITVTVPKTLTVTVREAFTVTERETSSAPVTQTVTATSQVPQIIPIISVITTDIYPLIIIVAIIAIIAVIAVALSRRHTERIIIDKDVIRSIGEKEPELAKDVKSIDMYAKRIVELLENREALKLEKDGKCHELFENLSQLSGHLEKLVNILKKYSDIPQRFIDNLSNISNSISKTIEHYQKHGCDDYIMASLDSLSREIRILRGLTESLKQ